MARSMPLVLVMLAVAFLATPARAQTTTYHLHAASAQDPVYRELSTVGPAPAGTAIQTANLKGQVTGGSMAVFETDAGTGLGGTIPSGSTVTFSVWMKKTATYGVFDATGTLQLNGATTVCSATSQTAISTTSQAIAFSCSLGTGISQLTTDLLRVYVGYSIVQSATHNVQVELDIDGSTDSTIVVPNPVPPHINSVNPTSGPANWGVAISGSGFGGTQGSSTVKFNGAVAAVSSWSDATINAVVPTGLAPGAGTVAVTVDGASSNTAAFTVIPPPILTNVAPNPAHVGDAVTLSGANFLATQGNSTVTFNGTAATPTSWSDTTIVAPVPAGATSGSLVVTVSGQSTSPVAFTVVLPGTIAGTISRASDSTPLQGATVQAVLAGVIKATATTPADGTYSFANLDPATYDLRVLATGYSSEVRSVALAPNGTSTVNVAMSQPGSITGRVTQANGVTPLSGAAVTMFLSGLQQGSGSTDASGNYSIAALHPGSYTLQVVDVGYHTKEQGAVITDGNTTTADVSLDPEPAGSVSYAYDALGRLISVVDPSGDAATYTYDAVGNILSIGRIGSGTVAITGIVPSSGPVGSAVTISGTGFSATPAENTVTFNGTPAAITSSTAAQIVVAVPAGATTGPIAVTAPLGSATSSTNFAVSAATAAPTISGFTPTIASPGTAVTVSGTNFDATAANDRVSVNQTSASVTSASASSIAITVPSAVASGPISVATQYGTAVSATDLIVPPDGYSPADVVFSGRIGFGDANAISVPVNTAGKIALVLFNGTAGHRVSFKVTNVGYPLGSITVYAPYNTQLASGSFTSSSGGFLDVNTLSVDGTYTVEIAPSSSYTGSVTLTAYDFADVTGSLTPEGSPATAQIQVPGQNARYTFVGAAGQRVSVQLGSGPVGTASIISGAGVSLGSVSTGATASFLDTVVLPAAGTYTLFFDPTGANTGSISLALRDASDVTYSITPGGPAVNVATTNPGQRAVASFSASAGQRVSVNATNLAITGTGCKGSLSVVDSNNVTLVTISCLSGATAFLDVTPALAAAVYRVILDPAVDDTGSATLTLYDVPADYTNTIVPGGDPVTVSISTPGQNAALTFTAVDQQRVSLNIAGGPLGVVGTCNTVKILKPDGSTVVSNGCVSNSGGFIDTQTLSPGGTYTIALDPSGTATGSLTFTLYDVPADFSGSIVPGGAAVTVPITTAGQNASLTFTATDQQRVSLNITGGPLGGGGTCNTVKILKPDGSTLLTNGCVTSSGAFIDTQTLSPGGTYTIVLDPSGTATGSLTFMLYNVPADVSGTLVANDPATTVSITTPGQNALMHFSGTSGQLVTVAITNNALTPSACVTVKLFRQDGTTQLASSFSCSASFNLTQQTLPATETYLVKIDPSGTSTGTIAVRVTHP